MELTPAKAKEIFERLKHIEKPLEDALFQGELKLALYGYLEARGFGNGWRQAIDKCSEIIEAKLTIVENHDSETGGNEELIDAKNEIIKLKVEL